MEKYVNLSELCTTEITDGTHKTPTYSETGYKFLSSKNVTKGKIDWNNIMYIPEDLHNELYKRIAPQVDDILLAKNGTTGVAALVDRDEVFDIYVSLALIRPDKNKVNPRYLLYAINSLPTKRFFDSHLKGVGVPNLHLTHIRETPIKIVDMDNQEKIVEKLDCLSRLIENNEKQLLKLDELIKSRFIEMFGDPIDNPLNWPVKRLKELSVQINSGNTPKGGAEVYVDKGITFFRSQNVWKDRLEMEDIAYIDEKTHLSMKRSSLKHGDILMTKTGRINTENSSLGRAALYLGEDDAANVNGHVYFIRLKPEVNNHFVLRILVSKEYRDLIRSVCVGGIDKRQLNKEHIEDFPIICPPTDMIEDYIAFVKQTDKSKFEIQKSLEKLEILKKSLMQQYFG